MHWCVGVLSDSVLVFAIFCVLYTNMSYVIKPGILSRTCCIFLSYLYLYKISDISRYS
jgi:hypothetical protein